MLKRTIQLLIAVVLVGLPYGLDSADARGGGGRGGASRGAGRSMGGSRARRGNTKGKEAKAFRERTARENHEAFKRDASGDAA